MDINAHSGKIQIVLKGEKILNDNFLWTDINELANVVQIITDFMNTKTVSDETGKSDTFNEFNDIMSHHLKDIRELAYMVYDIK